MKSHYINRNTLKQNPPKQQKSQLKQHHRTRLIRKERKINKKQLKQSQQLQQKMKMKKK
jgi:hypothetical protein